MKPLIFVVEDDINIQNVMKIALENSQYQVGCFENAENLFEKLKSELPQLFILDIMLPGMNGLEIIKKIKSKPQTKAIPILIVSAKTSELDKVLGLDLGADDYLIKPFGVLELISRVKALLRRSLPDSDKKTIEIKDLILDLSSHILKYQDKNEKLTKKQFDLMKYLMDNEGKALSREDIILNVWGFDFMGESRTLDVHIKELRKKLTSLTNKTNIIETIYGVGYELIL
ncbi:MAG: response regulator transcription factor [Candidatus Izimaplasma sp.]|nr:response regulator transcription factor [Candidatus Izimaplasma bacterium]